MRHFQSKLRKGNQIGLLKWKGPQQIRFMFMTLPRSNAAVLIGKENCKGKCTKNQLTKGEGTPGSGQTRREMSFLCLSASKSANKLLFLLLLAMFSSYCFCTVVWLPPPRPLRDACLLVKRDGVKVRAPVRLDDDATPLNQFCTPRASDDTKGGKCFSS